MHTPYAAAKIINAVLDSVELPNIPPQMVYNYTSGRIRQGKNPFIDCTIENNKIRISDQAIQAWLKKYLEKKGVKLDEQLELEV